MHRYTIKQERDRGHGTFNVYRDGDWLETVQTRIAAELIVKRRQEFDARHMPTKRRRAH